MSEQGFHSQTLPPELVQLVTPYEPGQRLRGEADFYGASGIIAEQLGRASIPRSYSSWSHGCHVGPWKYTEQILWVKDKVRHALVGTKEIEQFLTQAGVPNVRAVGVPLLYVKSAGVQRRSGSVLFMPAHSLEQVYIEHDSEVLVAEANRLKEQGHYVCFCVHQSCVRGSGIVAALEHAGIDWFAGASADDMHSLQRMRNSFEYFEFVASNTMGSHFYYAQLFGARFFFLSPYYEYSLKVNANAPSWRGKEHILAYGREKNLEHAVRQRYPEYFHGIQAAVCNQQMAKAACGASDMVNVKTLADLLGWGMWPQLSGTGRLLLSRLAERVKRTIAQWCSSH